MKTNEKSRDLNAEIEDFAKSEAIVRRVAVMRQWLQKVVDRYVPIANQDDLLKEITGHISGDLVLAVQYGYLCGARNMAKEAADSLAGVNEPAAPVGATP